MFLKKSHWNSLKIPVCIMRDAWAALVTIPFWRVAGKERPGCSKTHIVNSLLRSPGSSEWNFFCFFNFLNVGNLKILRCVYCSCCSHVLFMLRCTIWMAVTVWNVRMSKIRSRSCQKVSHYVQIFLLQWPKYEDYNVKVHIPRFVVPQSWDVQRSLCPLFCAHARQVTRCVHVIG